MYSMYLVAVHCLLVPTVLWYLVPYSVVVPTSMYSTGHDHIPDMDHRWHVMSEVWYLDLVHQVCYMRCPRSTTSRYRCTKGTTSTYGRYY